MAAFSDTNCRTSRFTAFWALPPVSLIDLEKNDGGWHHARSVATAKADEDEAEEEEAEEEEAKEEEEGEDGVGSVDGADAAIFLKAAAGPNIPLPPGAVTDTSVEVAPPHVRVVLSSSRRSVRNT